MIDFRQKPSYLPDLVIKGEKVEHVSQYKYLGTVLDNKLNFDQNTALIQKKCHSRMYLLQKLRNLNLNPSVLQMFYRAFIESVLTSSFLGMVWKSECEEQNSACKGCECMQQDRGWETGKPEWVVWKPCSAEGRKDCGWQCSAHVLARHFELLPSGRRYRMPTTRTLRAKNSFVPRSIVLCNLWIW